MSKAERTLLQHRYDVQRAKNADKRAAEMANLIDDGKTLREVAEIFGISAARVHQIVKRYDPTRFLNWREE